jgi:hypothetical protein
VVMFVHLTPEKHVKQILRAGIIPPRRPSRWLTSWPGCVYAMPVTPDFYLSHQWLRELKRQGQRTICAVYFRIPDEESVWVGHYSQNHRSMTAAEAVGLILESRAVEGYEVIISRPITAGEIYRVRHLPQVVGWRYQPGAHELSTCMCIVCNPPGTINSRKKGEAWEARQGQAASAPPNAIGRATAVTPGGSSHLD